ncbi:PREDICTED: uncharacterized protein LOC109471422 [Branchiostoma belcheri]|uniref:Uncharacterized protein LOC109471422 n=1 Tax=Branchiostoma belcheri TaxID=7741 RepID=A0A6P4YPF3_BRABE|nr:PREDICTED: uncharacterized protein LOC109471422 [Branchiostoma belcheri]
MSGNIVLPKLAVFGPQKEGEGDAIGRQKQRRAKYSKRRASVLPSVPPAGRTTHGKSTAVEPTASSLKIDVRHSGEFLPTVQESRHAGPGTGTTGMKNKFLAFLYLQHAVYGTDTYGQRGRAIRDRTDKNNLSVEGTDMRLPPPKAHTEPRRKSLLNVKSTSTVSTSSDASLETQAAEVDDPEAVEKGLKTLMNIHSMGIPIEITNKDYVPGVICRPLFHCARCRDVWNRLGEVPESCDQPSRPVRGMAFWLTREASAGLLQGVDPKSQAIRMKAGRHGEKLLLMGATTGSHRLLYDDEASSLLSLLRDLRNQAAARREEEEEDDDYWSYGTDEFSEEDLDLGDDGKDGATMRPSHRKEGRRRAQKASVRRRGSLETAPESHASSQDSGFASQQGGGAGHGLLPMLLRILERDSRPGSTRVLGDLDERQLVLQLLDASDDIDDAAWAEEGAHFLNSLKSNHVVRLTPNNLPALLAEIKRGTIAVQTGPDGGIRLGTYGPDGVFVPFEASDEDGRPISEQFSRMLESTLTSQLTQVLSSGGSVDPDSKGAAGLLKALMNNSDLASSDVPDIVNKLREHLTDDKQTRVVKEAHPETAWMADFMIDMMKAILKDGKLLTEDEVKQVLKSQGNENLILRRLSDGRLYFGVKDPNNGEFVPFGTYGEDGAFYFGAMDGNGKFQLTGRVDSTGNFEPGVVKDDGLFHVVEEGVSEAMASVMSKLKGQPGWLKQYVETKIRRQEVVVHMPDNDLDVTGEGADLGNEEDTGGTTGRQKRNKDDPLYDIRPAEGPTTSDLRQQYDPSSYEPFQRDAKGQKPTDGQTDAQTGKGQEGRTSTTQDAAEVAAGGLKGRSESFMSSKESSSLEPRLEEGHKVMIGSKTVKTLRQGRKTQDKEKIKNKYVKNRTGKPDTQPGKLADYPSTPAQDTGTPSLVSREGTFSSMVGSEASMSEGLMRQRRVSVSSNKDNSAAAGVAKGSDSRAVHLGTDARDGLAVQTEGTGAQDSPSRKRREIVKKTKRLSNQAMRYPNRANQRDGMDSDHDIDRNGMAGSQQDLRPGEKLASLSYKVGTDLSSERLKTIGLEGDDSQSLPARGLAPLPKSVKRASDVQDMVSPTPYFPDPKRNTLPPIPTVDNAGRVSKSPGNRRPMSSLAVTPLASTTEGDLDKATDFTVSNKVGSASESINSTETESGSSESSSESEFESVSRRRQRQKMDLPDLDGISALSFTRAFTYSYLPLPLAYRERNNKLRARAALFNQLKKPIRPAKKAKQDIGVSTTGTQVDKKQKTEKKNKSKR